MYAYAEYMDMWTIYLRSKIKKFKVVIYNYIYVVSQKKKKKNNYVYVGFNYVSNLIVILFNRFPIFFLDFM